MNYWKANYLADCVTFRLNSKQAPVIAGELFTEQEVTTALTDGSLDVRNFAHIFIRVSIPSQKVRHVFGKRVEIK